MQLERLGEHEIHYLSQQRPLLAMPETVSIQELRRRKGKHYELSVQPFLRVKNLLRSLGHCLAQRLGLGQGNLAGCLCLDPCGFQVLNQHITSRCVDAEGSARCSGPW